MTEPVHIHKNSSKIDFHALILFVPAFIFALVLAFYLIQFRMNQASGIATTQHPSVLGEQELDNP